jgi:hypothetical protein
MPFHVLATGITRTLDATDDVYIYKGSAGTGNEIVGMEPLIRTYFSAGNDNNAFNRVSFLKFDLSTLGNSILEAKFKLYGNVTSARTIEIYRTSGDNWAEDALTFNNFTQEVGSRTLIDTLRIEGEGAKYYEWEITSAVQAAKSEGKRYLSLMLKDMYSVKTSGGSGIVQDWHSKENESGNKPQLVALEKDNSQLELSSLAVDGEAIPDFDSKVYTYIFEIPSTTQAVPIVEGISVAGGAQLDVTPAANLSGTDEQRTTRVKVKYNGDSLTYSVQFNFLPPDNEAYLKSITVDGNSLTSFNEQTLVYTHNLPYTSTSAPAVTAVVKHPKSGITITPASDITGNINERTTTITVLSPDSTVTTDYEVVFTILPKMDLFLFIGQSNMAGRGKMTKEEEVEVINNTFLFNDKGSWESAVNPLNKYSNIRKDISQQKLCPAYEFSRKVVSETGKRIGIVVNAQGGSNISNWVKNGELYNKTLLRAKEAMKWGEYKAILWHQGESNSSATGVNRYPDQLVNMVSGLRSEFENDTLFFVAGELAYWRGGGTGSTAFNEMIRTIQSFIDNSDWVSADSLTPLIDESDPHFDGPSQKKLGSRYADKVLGKIYPNRTHLSDEKDMLSYSALYNGITYSGIITSDEIQVVLPFGADVTNIVSTFTVSAEASVFVGIKEQQSGVSANNFKNPIQYTVRAQDLSEKKYVVRVIAKPSFQSYSIIVPSTFKEYTGVIMDTSITVTLPALSSKASLLPFFELSADSVKVFVDGVEQRSGESLVDFLMPVTYRLVIQNLTTSYKVSVDTESTTSVDKSKGINPNMYAIGNRIYVENLEGTAQLTLFNMQGHSLLSKTISPPTAIDTKYTGVHVVLLRQREHFFVRKLLLQLW